METCYKCGAKVTDANRLPNVYEECALCATARRANTDRKDKDMASREKSKAFVGILNAVARGTREGYSTLRFAAETIREQDNLNACGANLEDLYGQLAKEHMVLTGDAVDTPEFKNAEDYFLNSVPYITRMLNRLRKNALRVAEFRRTGKVPRR